MAYSKIKAATPFIRELSGLIKSFKTIQVLPLESKIDFNVPIHRNRSKLFRSLECVRYTLKTNCQSNSVYFTRGGTRWGW